MPTLGFQCMYWLACAENATRLATALSCSNGIDPTSLLLEQIIQKTKTTKCGQEHQRQRIKNRKERFQCKHSPYAHSQGHHSCSWARAKCWAQRGMAKASLGSPPNISLYQTIWKEADSHFFGDFNRLMESNRVLWVLLAGSSSSLRNWGTQILAPMYFLAANKITEWHISSASS